MKAVRGYIFSRPFMAERVPQHVQNLVIRDYCERNKLQFLLSATEYAMPHSHLILAQVIDELEQIDGLVSYSLFQLPETPSQRHKVYDQAIVQRSGKTLHFAVEGLRVSTVADCERIETLWQIRQTLACCPQSVA
jgi:sporadic carbohydrate cluster protein (TIGR04323 family)